MTFLLINLMVLAAIAAAGVLWYAQVLQSASGDEWLASAPSIDYGAIQAHWRGRGPVRDWESLQSHVRRWQQTVAAGRASVPAEQVALNLNQAVFRFEIPDALQGDAAAAAPAQHGRPVGPARGRVVSGAGADRGPGAGV